MKTVRVSSILKLYYNFCISNTNIDTEIIIGNIANNTENKTSSIYMYELNFLFILDLNPTTQAMYK